MTSLALGMAELDNIWFEILMLGIVGMVMGIVRNHLLIEILHELRKQPPTPSQSTGRGE